MIEPGIKITKEVKIESRIECKRCNFRLKKLDGIDLCMQFLKFKVFYPEFGLINKQNK